MLSKMATRSISCSYSLLFLTSLCQDTNWAARAVEVQYVVNGTYLVALGPCTALVNPA